MAFARETQKKPIIEFLFWNRLDNKMGWVERANQKTGEIPEEHRTVYTQELCQAYHRITGQYLTTPYAFFSDSRRRLSRREENWPEALKELRWTAETKTGGAVWKFRPYDADQILAAPDDVEIDLDAPRIVNDTLDLSYTLRRVTRMTESIMLTIMRDTRMLQSHFSQMSPLRSKIVDIRHTVPQVKMNGSEVDSLAEVEIGNPYSDRRTRLLVTIEAKCGRNHLSKSQVVRQVNALAKDIERGNYACAGILPLVILQVEGGIYVCEYKPFLVPQAKTDGKFGKIIENDLVKMSCSIHEFAPGIACLEKSFTSKKSAFEQTNFFAGGQEDGQDLLEAVAANTLIKPNIGTDNGSQMNMFGEFKS